MVCPHQAVESLRPMESGMSSTGRMRMPLEFVGIDTRLARAVERIRQVMEGTEELFSEQLWRIDESNAVQEQERFFDQVVAVGALDALPK